MTSVNDVKLKVIRKARQDTRKSYTQEAQLMDMIEGIENPLEDIKSI